MTYYILPKNHAKLIIDPHISFNTAEPYISHSLFFYLNNIKTQLINLCTEEKTFTFGQLIKLITPYEYIHSKIPNYKLSVSKLKPFSNIFYNIFEINKIINITDYFNHDITSIHFGSNYLSTIEYMNIFREFNNDIHIGINFQNTIIDDNDKQKLKNINKNSIDFLFFELDDNFYKNKNKYVLGFVKILIYLLYFQKSKGCVIIKISDVFYKPIIDAITIISSLYDKIYIIKPNTTNIVSSEKYLVCKNYLLDENREKEHLIYYEALLNFIKLCDYINLNNNNIENNEIIINSLLKYDTNYYFLNKIEEFNIIIGQSQLEAYNYLINILKHKNREEKMESLKKININKCITWCEKNGIPYNKLADKINIFVPLIKIDNEESPINIDSHIQIEDLNPV